MMKRRRGCSGRNEKWGKERREGGEGKSKVKLKLEDEEHKMTEGFESPWSA